MSIFAPETAASLFDTECVAPLDLPGYPTAHLETNHHRSVFLLPIFGSPNPDYPSASTSQPSTQEESTWSQWKCVRVKTNICLAASGRQPTSQRFLFSISKRPERLFFFGSKHECAVILKKKLMTTRLFLFAMPFSPQTILFPPEMGNRKAKLGCLASPCWIKSFLKKKLRVLI